MIHIVDYGLGNIQAIVTTYKRLGIPTVRATKASELTDAKKLILPGVGAFDHAMHLLEASGIRTILDRLVIKEKCPVLGICVGMQILTTSSEEGKLAGLGWIPGKVKAFNSVKSVSDLPLPHMGWNNITSKNNISLFDGLEHGASFYFLHSYFFECDYPEQVAATASYGVDFTCAVASDNIYGVQFHPEKSHHFGSKLLKNFAEI